MRVTKSRLAIVLALAAITALAVWIIVLNGKQGESGYFLRALSLPAALALFTIVIVVVPLFVASLTRGIRRRKAVTELPAPLSEDLVNAAEAQARRAEDFIARVGDPSRRGELTRELSELRAADLERAERLDVVVFGTGSAGKTSLISALLGRSAGAIEAVMGTTRRGESHTYELRGVEGSVDLTDTPGLGEASSQGEARENEARSLAARADLLLFVVDHDLIRSEYEPLVELVRLGKRSIVVLNKKDRFPEEDLAAILAKLRERLAGVVDPADIVAIAAAPKPIPIRFQRPDGTIETTLELQHHDIAPLRKRIAEVLKRDGRLLHVANLLVRGRILEQEAQEQLTRERDQKALAAVEHFQWLTAGTVFANPIPALDILAGGAVQLEMISELARIHGIVLSAGQVRSLAAQMVQALLKLGLIETATSLIAGVFKRTVVGFAAGGAAQAVAMAYLTRVSGKAFIDHFRQGQSWGRDGVDGTVLRQFELNGRSEFLQDFVRQVTERVLRSVIQRGLQPSQKSGR
jgi:small GTP-binding protein